MADGQVHHLPERPQRRKARPLTALQEFVKLESSGGIILVMMMLVAMAMVNSPLASYYEAFLSIPVQVRVGPLDIAKPLLLWINDGLMAIFFVLVSLEIKRELIDGELSSLRHAALPAFAAAGGMAVPAAIYIITNGGNPEALHGWAIPSATDIAFSLGVLSLLGRRVPVSLKVFLAALAILDDLGAIVIIAVFYTSKLSLVSLGLAVLGTIFLFHLNRLGVRRLAPYVLTAIFLWVCVLKSGVHATLAGVALGLAMPIVPDQQGRSPLRDLEHALHPWVAFGILPLFALANSGLSLREVGLDALTNPVVLGIGLGLFLGKQVGVFSVSWLVIRLGWARMPQGANWSQFYGVSVLTGIGFTMSLFIGSLAFEGGRFDAETRLGVLLGSIASAGLGYALLRLLSARQQAKSDLSASSVKEASHERAVRRSRG